MNDINPGTNDENDGIFLDEYLNNIKENIKAGSIGDDRIDLFKEMFEKFFAISIDEIDDIEEQITENGVLQAYDYIMDMLINYFDNYFEIKINKGNPSIDLEFIYNVYDVFYVNFIYYMAKYICGKLMIDHKNNVNEFLNSVNKKDGTEYDIIIAPYIEDENVFDFEDMLTAISLSDPGNEIIIKMISLINATIFGGNNVAIRERIVKEVSEGENRNAILRLIHKFLDKEKIDG